MFYSEQLLSKTGPLARVWLASNVERKLSKSQILQSDIQSSIGAIVDQGQAPMALRLSGQLMLGVVRIYGRKARYLLDDCNEALLKIRMTFKNTNNHDLPAHATAAIDLNLPELLTIDDLFPSMDFAYPLTQQPAIEAAEQLQDLDEDWTSTLNPQPSTSSRLETDDNLLMNDEDLGLDLGDRDDIDPNETGVSVQYGRNAPTPRPLAEEVGGDEPLFEEDDLNLDTGADIVMEDDGLGLGGDIELPSRLPGQEELPLFGGDETLQLRQAQEQRRRESESPLSEAGSEVRREMDQSFATEGEDVSEVVVQQRQRIRKLKQMVPDVETILHNKQIKAQSEDRSKILKPPSFLPRDPLLLTLMNMQRNGDFVTNGMNDGRSRDWAPELQGLLSFEVVQRSGQLKRKRDSGIGGLSEDEHSEKSPRLDLDDDDLMADEAVDLGQDLSALRVRDDSGVEPISTDAPGLEDVIVGEDEEGIFGGDTFDDTTMPLLHPADSGPVSLGTKRAVHLLREKFGGQPTDGSPSSQSKKSVLLQELVPEGRTSKEDATKMFFEILVLATKDAIKVEQDNKAIGLPLRIRGKRGLWGAWAETSVEDEQEETTSIQPVAVSA